MPEEDPGLIGPRGQVEIKRGGIGGELRLPLAQAGALALIGIVALVVLLADMIMVGPVSGMLVGILIIAGLWRLAFRWIEHYATIAAGVLGIAWLAGGGQVVTMIWPEALLMLSLPPWAVLIGLLLSVPMLVGCGLVAYRLAYEIVDPWWPPPLANRTPDFGIAWPGQRVEEEDEESTDDGRGDELAQIRETLQELLSASRQPMRERLVLINGNTKELPDAHEVVEIMLEQIEGDWCAYLKDHSPVRVQDIQRLASLGERVGLSYRKTRALFRWGEATWRSALATLEALGVVECEGGQREATMLVSPEEAVRMVDAKLVIPDDTPPPPDQATETVVSNVADDRQTVQKVQRVG